MESVPRQTSLPSLLFGASGVFGELRTALNKMWDVKTHSAGGVWGTIKQRFFSFGIVLAVGFLLLVSLVISAALAAFGRFFGGLLQPARRCYSRLSSGTCRKRKYHGERFGSERRSRPYCSKEVRPARNGP